MNKKTIATMLALLITAIVSHYLTKLFWLDNRHVAAEQGIDEPLYWVAPMNPDYTKDGPGKSPMGMDLVPVYASNVAKSDSPGIVTISPDVVNNLGVRTATASLRTQHTEITTVGYVKYDEDQLVHIHPRVEGWIENLYVKAAGDPVQKGEPLYALYSPQLVNAQEELILALNRSNARLLQASQERLQALNIDKKVIEQLKKDRKVKQNVTFFAPQTGVVDNLNIREGFFVKPGTTLMSIANLDDVWVEAEVFERQASLVEVGLPVTMNLDYLPGQQWQGMVDYVYPSLDPKTRTARVRLRFSNIDGLLKPNMFAQVAIHADQSAPVLTIPKEAVIRTGKQNRVVLAMGEGRFKSIAITLGRMDDHYAQIVTGLKAGDRVVSSAQFLLDSESSKRSDFKRMNHDDDDDENEVIDEPIGIDHSQHRMEDMP